MNNKQGEWSTALVYLDPSREYRYKYHSEPKSKKISDDHRFALEEREIVPWLWEKGKPAPQRILPKGHTLLRAMEAESGGPQGEGGGALPYPPG